MKQIIFLAILTFLVSPGFTSDQYASSQEFDQYKHQKVFDFLKSFVKPRSIEEYDEDDWKGRWFPESENDPQPPPKVYTDTFAADNIIHKEDNHRIEMGVSSDTCDDAKTNLTLDWDNSPVNYTCYTKRIIPDLNINPMIFCERIPKRYEAIHKCMYETIEYDTNIPTFGTHRPLWPVYGEYKFVPRQRWLHSLEHGGVVMLYHPCANQMQVKLLKSLVKNCLRRHVITPYNLLDEDRPLVLVTWGCRLEMSYVDPVLVKQFIKDKALQGPEKISFDGDFTEGLISEAKTVSDFEDTVLCPKM